MPMERQFGRVDFKPLSNKIYHPQIAWSKKLLHSWKDKYINAVVVGKLSILNNWKSYINITWAKILTSVKKTWRIINGLHISGKHSRKIVSMANQILSHQIWLNQCKRWNQDWRIDQQESICLACSWVQFPELDRKRGAREWGQRGQPYTAYSPAIMKLNWKSVTERQ